MGVPRGPRPPAPPQAGPFGPANRRPATRTPAIHANLADTPP
ncbi:hypothetical protein I546_2434 [Mycobacterium kansasii 732]|nr:hypothetical protein I546_2434 [Mycobacterium kansasii 732]